MTHLEGFIYSQEKCNHIGEMEFVTDGIRSGVLRAKDFSQAEGKRLALPYDTLVCLNCGQTQQLAWRDYGPATEEGKSS